MRGVALLIALVGAPAPPVPPEVIADLREGDRKLAEGRAKEALAAYGKALRGVPGEPGLRVAVALQLLRCGLPELRRPAYGLVREALALDPDNFAANRLLGDWYFERNFFRESHDRYGRALKQRPRDPGTLHNLALSLAGLKRFKEAYDVAAQAVEASSGGGRYRVGQAWVCVDWRREKEALKALKLVDPSTLEGYDRNLFYRVRAQASFQAGDRDGAITDLERLTEIAPGYSKGFELLGLYYQRAARFDDAAEAYKKAIALDARNEAAHYGLGQVCMRLRKVEEGRRELALYETLARERQEERVRNLKEMSEELKDRQVRGWIPGM